jgi:hypothetical protein
MVKDVLPVRYSLTCSLCKEKQNGACIQCSAPHCKRAFHVTCSIAAQQRMPVVIDEATDLVHRNVYCFWHRDLDKSKETGVAATAAATADMATRTTASGASTTINEVHCISLHLTMSFVLFL